MNRLRLLACILSSYACASPQGSTPPQPPILSECPPAWADASGQRCTVGLTCDYGSVRCDGILRMGPCGNEACIQGQAEIVEAMERGEMPMARGVFHCQDVRCPSSPPAEGSPCEPLETVCFAGSTDPAECIDGAWHVEVLPSPM